MDDRHRYERAAHAMQAGAKMECARTNEHPQSRIGINTALRDHASLALLLVAKGIITEDEYLKAVADGMEDEVRQLEARLSSGGTKITLVGRYGSVHDEDTTS